MLGVREISCICITRFAGWKGEVVFEAKILSVDVNAYSEMRTIKYLSFIPETRDLADTSLPVECHTSTCGNRRETNIRTEENAAICVVLGNNFNLMHVRTLHVCRSEHIDEISKILYLK